MTQKKRKNKPGLKDWHRADIIAALHKAGWSLRRLSISSGYTSPGTLVNALERTWPKGERIIAEALGIEPAQIWPSRYTEDALARRQARKAAQVFDASDFEADDISSIAPLPDGELS